MKKVLTTIICIGVLALSGCNSNGEKPKIKLKGFSIGAMYLNTNLNMGYGQSAQIKEVVPIGFFNFEF